MNKELMKEINRIIRDNIFYDIDTEIKGVRESGVQEIIALCANEAIEAAENQFKYSMKIVSATELKQGIVEAIEARMIGDMK